MAQVRATASAITNLLSTLAKVINEVSVDLKSDFERLELHVRSMREFYQIRKDDPLYQVEGLETALKTETALVEDTHERLKKLTQPQLWQINKKLELKEFLKESEKNLQQSNQTVNNLLTHIGTGALIKIANQGQNDPDSTDMERSNAGQAGVKMDNKASGNIQDGTDQTDNGNVTMDSDVSYDMIHQLMTKIGSNWRDVGRKLGLNETTMQEVHEDNHQSLREKAYNVLLRWRTSTNRSTYRVLSDALKEAERMDLKKFVEANFQKYHKD